jgi:hypothetical protein
VLEYDYESPTHYRLHFGRKQSDRGDGVRILQLSSVVRNLRTPAANGGGLPHFATLVIHENGQIGVWGVRNTDCYFEVFSVVNTECVCSFNSNPSSWIVVPNER